MTKAVFISLPVADVAKSTAFYEAIGFEKDQRFSGEHASSMRWSDEVTFMLASRDCYSTLTTKPLADSQATSAMLIALARDSRAAVDAITEAATPRAGGKRMIPKTRGACTAAPSTISTATASGRCGWTSTR